jgi:lysophospholipase L1-like esterase
MFRSVIILFLAFSLATRADSTTIWPLPTRPDTIVPTLFPTPRTGLETFQKNINLARSRPVDLLFDGDDITAFWQTYGKDAWQKHYGSLNAFDFAQAKDRTENLLWRLQNGELEGLHPKLIVLMIGAENLDNGIWDRTPSPLGDTSTPEEAAAGVRAIIDTYREKCPDSHILLLGTLPRTLHPYDPQRAAALTASIKAFNGLISKLDDGKSVTYLDFGSAFLDSWGHIPPALTPNALDPSEKGYEIWANAIQPVVDQYCPTAALSAPQESDAMSSWISSAAITSYITVSGTPLTLSWPYATDPPAGVPRAAFPVPHLNYGMTRYIANIDKLKNGPYDLVFDGDSITDIWDHPMDAKFQFYPGLQERFKGIKVLNLGVGSDQTQNLLWRVQHGELDGQDPKLIVLLIGTNNANQRPEWVAHANRLIIDEYEKRCPHAHILLMGIFPRGQHPAHHVANDILATFPATDPRITFMDIGAKFLEPDGSIGKDMMNGYVHPTEKGYAIWGDAIQPVIDQFFPNTVAK